MKYILCLFLLCPLGYAAPCPTAQRKDEAALAQNEQNWARALEEQDISALVCILADEFEDVGPTGEPASRTQVLQRADQHRGVHHELSELHAHVYGDFAYIRGLATTPGAPGRPTIKVRFTDVYVYRDGRWQCVAGQESSIPPPRVN